MRLPAPSLIETWEVVAAAEAGAAAIVIPAISDSDAATRTATVGAFIDSATAIAAVVALAATTAAVAASIDASASATRVTIGAVLKRNSVVQQKLLELMEVPRGRLLGWAANVAGAMVGTVEGEPRQ